MICNSSLKLHSQFQMHLGYVYLLPFIVFNSFRYLCLHYKLSLQKTQMSKHNKIHKFMGMTKIFIYIYMYR